MEVEIEIEFGMCKAQTARIVRITADSRAVSTGQAGRHLACARAEPVPDRVHRRGKSA